MSETISGFSSPAHTVDVIVELSNQHCDGYLVLVSRKNAPFGWALPGGFVEYGESLWDAACREVYEETQLEVQLQEQFYSYSDPLRFAPRHVITTVFIGKACGIPTGGDDALEAHSFSLEEIPLLQFDHGDIVSDYLHWRLTGERPGPKREVSRRVSGASVTNGRVSV